MGTTLKIFVSFDNEMGYLKVSKIIVKSTNFPRRGTTNEVGGMISANRRKNTVRERRILIERLTYRILQLLLTFTVNYYWFREI